MRFCDFFLYQQGPESEETANLQQHLYILTEVGVGRPFILGKT